MAQISINRTGTLSVVSIEDGTSTARFLSQQNVSLASNSVRVSNDNGSRRITAENADNVILTQGDTVSITPMKQAAA